MSKFFLPENIDFHKLITVFFIFSFVCLCCVDIHLVYWTLAFQVHYIKEKKMEFI